MIEESDGRYDLAHRFRVASLGSSASIIQFRVS